MKNTVKECEDPGIEGEEKLRTASLESMIDLTHQVGKNVRAEKFTITGVKKIGDGKKVVACHKQNYPYVVFYCHAMDRTRLYMVQLVGVDGTKTKAVTVCHTNTKSWNPKHLAFQLLKVKPGTVPICHFLPEDYVVWVRN
ncbi:hypothetical protein K2173_025867 [Erythroxylum novogranatense]|uniref:BURP domain-containing protein n=1 Tax=Erythroxylum novogranatense TaxID=1862640 RepID=A0AAV8SI34_9ROSI|nr:hypothetical protein K2173_025867 [Erythroxylum novogranatense]